MAVEKSRWRCDKVQVSWKPKLHFLLSFLFLCFPLLLQKIPDTQHLCFPFVHLSVYPPSVWSTRQCLFILCSFPARSCRLPLICPSMCPSTCPSTSFPHTFVVMLHWRGVASPVLKVPIATHPLPGSWLAGRVVCPCFWQWCPLLPVVDILLGQACYLNGMVSRGQLRPQ